MTSEDVDAMFAKIAQFVGEHCNSFVFVAEFDDPNGESCMAHKYEGPVHQALGLVEAFKIRMQAEANYEFLEQMEDADCDGPEDPLT